VEIPPIVLWICSGMLFGWFSGFLADEKGYDMTRWFMAGFLFLIIGFIAVIGLPDKRARRNYAEPEERSKDKQLVR
jgi:F0F1-type ATP synthase assembly protein I